MILPVVWNVHKCSACGKEHPLFSFERLDAPVSVNGHDYEYGSPCPTTGVMIYATGAWTETAWTRRDKTMLKKYGRK